MLCAGGGTQADFNALQKALSSTGKGRGLALVPEDPGAAPPGMRLVEVPDLGAAFSRLF